MQVAIGTETELGITPAKTELTGCFRHDLKRLPRRRNRFEALGAKAPKSRSISYAHLQCFSLSFITDNRIDLEHV